MCRRTTIDQFFDAYDFCLADWLIGLCTYQPVVMAKAEQRYKDFLSDLLVTGEIDESHHKRYLDYWSKACNQKKEEFNNGK